MLQGGAGCSTKRGMAGGDTAEEAAGLGVWVEAWALLRAIGGLRMRACMILCVCVRGSVTCVLAGACSCDMRALFNLMSIAWCGRRHVALGCSARSRATQIVRARVQAVGERACVLDACVRAATYTHQIAVHACECACTHACTLMQARSQRPRRAGGLSQMRRSGFEKSVKNW